MANDDEVNIGTKVDESGLDKGLKSVKNKVQNTSNDLTKGAKATNALKTAFNETGGAASSFASKMGGIATSGGAAAAGVAAAVAVAKKYIETLKEANEAYKVQEKAEKALRQAADNNPYLNGESVRRLKEYAGELQSVSNYGDEGTIDIMAQLASTGRTEAEIMKIMGAAADYAAATHTDLASAAQTLNATYSGMSGTLGKQVGEIKDLTAEQLKNGEAIDLIAKKYKGFAQEAADSGTQAKNAFGDLMESIGRIANPTFEAINRIAKSIFENLTKGIDAFNNALETASRKWGGIKNSVDDGIALMFKAHTDSETGETKGAEKLQTKEYLEWLKKEIELRGDLNGDEQQALIIIKEELRLRARIAEQEKKRAEEERKRNAENKRQQEAQKAADDYARESNKKLQESLNALEVEARAKGEAVSAQDKYNVYLQSYIDLLTKTEGAIREGYPVEQKRLEQLKEAKRAVDEAADAEKKLSAAIEMTQAATDALNSANRHLTPAEELEAEVRKLDEIKAKILAMSDAEIAAAQAGADEQLSKAELIAGLNEAEKQATLAKLDEIAAAEQGWWDKYASQQQELLDMKRAIDESEVLSEEEKIEAMRRLDEEYAESRKQQFADLAAEIKGYTDQAVQVMKEAASLMLDAVKWQSEAEIAELELKYRKGEISEDEYNEAVTESKRKAAKEQYKIQMFQWSASILQATANIAEGVTKAIAQGGIAGLITGALVSAAGAVQIASIIASKPTPPSFSTGGIVGGTSYYGDNVAANLNSREMVMNMGQQKALWDFINGGSNGAGGGANIVINNSASNVVSAQPQITKDKIEILIDARVNESLKNGRYNSALNQAQQSMSGDYYGI